MKNGVSINYASMPESDLVVDYIYERYRKGLYTHVPVTGLPGTGKSSTCQRLGELFYEKIGKGWKLEAGDIVDSLLDFLKRLKQVEEPGEVIIIEEISVLFPSRRAMARENVAIGRVLDTCRKKGVILFSNAPIFTSIDSHVRAMSHILLETQKIVKTQEVVVSKAWKLQTNPHTGKTYRHRFRRNGRDIGLFYTKKPHTETWEEYEGKKDKFMDELYKDLEGEQQKKQDKKDKANGKTPRPPITKLTELELQVHHMYNIKKMTNGEIARELKKHPPQITNIIKNINKKATLTEENEGLTIKKDT